VTSSPVRALFDFSAPAYFTEAEPFLTACRDAGWHCEVVFEWSGRGCDEMKARCRALGFTVTELPDDLVYSIDEVSQPQASPASQPPAAQALGPRQRLYRAMQRYSPALARLAELTVLLRRLSGLRRWGEDFVRRARPNVVLFGPFNSYGRAANALFGAAKRAGIARVCMPSLPLMGEPYQILERFESERRGIIGPKVRTNYDLFNRVCSLLLRSWTRTNGRDGFSLFHRDPVEIIAGRLSGLNFTDGWQKPSPFFDRVFLPTPQSVRCLETANFPMERAVMTGMPRMDAVLSSLTDQRRREEFFRSIRLPVGAPYIVLNVEPAAEHHVANWDDHWFNFKRTLGIASSARLPVVLSLHPLCAPENYHFAEAEFGAIVSHPRNIYELVAHSVLVVSNVCSTLLPTQIFQKPTIVYDFYGVPNNVSQFFGLDRYAVCKTLDSFEKEFKEMVASLSVRRAVEDVHLQAASRVMLDEIDALLATRQDRHEHVAQV